MGQLSVWFSKCYQIALLSLVLFLLKVESKQCYPDSYKPCKLYAAGFFPLSERIPQGAIGRGVMPAVDLALQSINSDPSVIKGYQIDLVRKDTECDPAVGMKAFFDMIDSEPKKLMLFGDACTSVTDPIAKASKFFHLLQLSYADTNPMYIAESYPNFYRVVPSEAAFNPARLALLQRFNWTKVGTIYESSPRYSMPHSKLLTDLDEVNIQIEFTQTISEDIQAELQKLKDKGVRIILGNFGEKWARRIFCQAYKHGIYGRKYQWIIAGEYNDKWWETVDPNLECNLDELLQALDGYIATDVLPLSSSQEIAASGMTAADYEIKYNEKRGKEYSKFHGYAYDGMWTIAFALKYVKAKLLARNLKITLEDFDYRKPFWSQIFKEALNQTFFTGVTGNVSFDGNERRGSILLKQFQNGKEVKIGEYHSTTDELNLNVGEKITWQGSNTPPVDRIIEEIVASRISLTLFIVISIFAVIGIILALVFLSMNIKYRKQRYIKMSSPYLNNIIIIGCILTYTSVILLGLDSRLLNENNFPYICAARAWVLMSGFTLAFGSMFSKTWRVHAIFTNIKLNKKVIKDYQLFLIVAILISIDVATLTTWQIVDPFYRETAFGTPEPSPENEDILIVPQMEYCHSRRMTVFLGSIYVYKGLLMAFGCFLAWETRHVSIPALNDSKYIGMSVYNVVIMCVIGAGLSFVLKEQQDAAFLIISIFIIFCSTATLCLVFVPKLIEHKRYPNVDERRVRPTLKPLKKYRQASDEMELHARIKVLHEFNTRQRQRLKEKTYELEALMFRLRQYGIELTSISADIKRKAECVISNTVQSFEERKKDFEYLIVEKDFESSRLTKSEKETSSASLSASITALASKENLETNQSEKSRNSCPELQKCDIKSLMTFDLMTARRRNTHFDFSSLRLGKKKFEKFNEFTLLNKNHQNNLNSFLEHFDNFKNTSPSVNNSIKNSKNSSTATKVIYSIEHDDNNSYNKAIKASIDEKPIFSELSVSCEKDEKFFHDYFKENDQKKLCVNKPRSQSLSTLHFHSNWLKNLALENSSTKIKQPARVRHESIIKALFPHVGGFSNLTQDMTQKTPLFSSQPMIKCDIVEYL